MAMNSYICMAIAMESTYIYISFYMLMYLFGNLLCYI